jgi:hypothetical protein
MSKPAAGQRIRKAAGKGQRGGPPKARRVGGLRGKYAFVPTTSDAFARRKRVDIAREG